MSMSTLYLPNGGRIIIYCGWKSSLDANTGHVTLKKHDETYLGSIHSNGAVHLSAECTHTYYRPGTTLDSAFEVIKKDIRKLAYWQLKALKSLLSDYNIRSNTWKK